MDIKEILQENVKLSRADAIKILAKKHKSTPAEIEKHIKGNNVLLMNQLAKLLKSHHLTQADFEEED